MSRFAAVCCPLLVLLACADTPPVDTGGSESSESDFAIPDPVDPHARVAAEVLATREAIVAWPGEQLAHEPYIGALRSPAGVLSARLGNDWDRCHFTRHLLGAIDIPTRLATDGEACAVEAWIDDTVVAVATGIAPTVSDASWTRRLDTPSEVLHRVVVSERIDAQTYPLVDLAMQDAASLRLTYSAALSLQLRIGDATFEGRSVEGASRHTLLVEHVTPDGTSVTHERELFDAASVVGNQQPDPDRDTYGVWLGAFLPSVDYVQREADLLIGDGASEPDVLAWRAVQLAFQTDEAAWGVVRDDDPSTPPDEQPHLTARDLRVIVAALEQRTPDSVALTPSFDLLANPRTLTEARPELEVAIGWTDALTEAAFLRELVDAPVLSVATLFAALLGDEPVAEATRLQAIGDALARLLSEGDTGDALQISDPDSDASVTVQLVGIDLVVPLDATRQGVLEAVADQLGGMILEAGRATVTPDEVGAEVIQLLLLESGAALDHRLRLAHISGVEGALVTPNGTVVSGTGTHQGTDMTFRAIARSFERTPPGATADLDILDWEVRDSMGSLLPGGDMRFETPSITVDGRDMRLLAFGTEPSTVSVYESPLWLPVSIADALRTETPTEIRVAYETGNAASWESADLTVFSDDVVALDIDGMTVDIAVVTAETAAGDFGVTLARNGQSRLVLAAWTPNSASAIETLRTPRALRLRARALSQRGADEVPFYVPVPDASLSYGIPFAEAWPDGSLDARVPDTSQPTLDASIAILVDTSGSMAEAADPTCTSDCDSRLDVVSAALQPIVASVSSATELAVWTLDDDLDDTCARALRAPVPWTLSREAPPEAPLYTTRGTPLTGAIEAALGELDSGWGQHRRLIVLSDGANTCDDDLSSLAVTTGVTIHTIGVGLEAGGADELELESLALRTRGTYTRTIDGSSLSAALTSVATLAPPMPPPRAVSVEVVAPEHESVTASVPVDTDGIEIVMTLAPDADRPTLVVWMPDAPAPDLDLDQAVWDLLERERAMHPGSAFILPDQPVGLGPWHDAFGWLQVDLVTGETTAMTYDGLHGAAGVPNLGATVAGLWTGVDIVAGNFATCVLAPDGCGPDADTIEDSICSTEGLEGALLTGVMRLLGGIFPAQGGDLESRFEEGIQKVEARCRGEYGLQQFANDACADLGGPDDCGDLITDLWSFYAGFL